jgi:hypothetical protein
VRPETDAAILRGYVTDPFAIAALNRVLLAARNGAVTTSSERFLSREWREKAEEYRRELDGLREVLEAEAEEPCRRFLADLSDSPVCPDDIASVMACRPCWVRRVLKKVAVG